MNRSLRYGMSTVVLILVTALFLGACSTQMRIGMLLDGPESRALPRMSHNSEVSLDAGTYQASEISHNRVSLVGRGEQTTSIVGDLHISGNNVRIGHLTIGGDVRITGNNVDLEDVQISGTVNDNGQNNRW